MSEVQFNLTLGELYDIVYKSTCWFNPDNALQGLSDYLIDKDGADKLEIRKIMNKYNLIIGVKYREVCNNCGEEHIFDTEQFYDKNGNPIEYESTESYKNGNCYNCILKEINDNMTVKIIISSKLSLE